MEAKCVVKDNELDAAFAANGMWVRINLWRVCEPKNSTETVLISLCGSAYTKLFSWHYYVLNFKHVATHREYYLI